MPCDKNTPKRGRGWLIFNKGLQLLQDKGPKFVNCYEDSNIRPTCAEQPGWWSEVTSYEPQCIQVLEHRKCSSQSIENVAPRAQKTQLPGHDEYSSIQSGLGLNESNFGHTNIGRNLVTGWSQVQVSFDVPPLNLQMRHHVACLGL